MNRFLITIFLIISSITFGQTDQSIYNQDKETILEYFRTETVGGKLDFELKMKDDKAPLYRIGNGNILYNRKDFGILLWAQAIKLTGKFSKKESLKLWKKIKQRKLTKPEKRAFYKGFDMEISMHN